MRSVQAADDQEDQQGGHGESEGSEGCDGGHRDDAGQAGPPVEIVFRDARTFALLHDRKLTPVRTPDNGDRLRRVAGSGSAAALPVGQVIAAHRPGGAEGAVSGVAGSVPGGAVDAFA